MNKQSQFYADICSSTEPQLESFNSAYMKVKRGEGSVWKVKYT